MAEVILGIGFIAIAMSIRNARLKWKKLDRNIDKLVAIEKAQELINKAKKNV